MKSNYIAIQIRFSESDPYIRNSKNFDTLQKAQDFLSGNSRETDIVKIIVSRDDGNNFKFIEAIQ